MDFSELNSMSVKAWKRSTLLDEYCVFSQRIHIQPIIKSGFGFRLASAVLKEKSFKTLIPLGVESFGFRQKS